MAISEIANTPALLAECRAALPAIRARAVDRPSDKEREAIIGAKFATYRQPERTPVEWAAFWLDYHTVLADVSTSALQAAMAAIIHDPAIEFLPKPAKLRQIALTTENKAVKAYDRARQAVEFEQPKPALETPFNFGVVVRRPPPQPSAAERERVRRQARDYLAKDEERQRCEAARRRPAMPSAAGAADEGGLTPAMRALLAQKREGGAA